MGGVAPLAYLNAAHALAEERKFVQKKIWLSDDIGLLKQESWPGVVGGR